MSISTVSNTTLEYFDGFDDYNTAQINRYWTSVFGNYQITSGGRNGSNCLMLVSYSDYVKLTLPSKQTRTVGFAFKPSGFSQINGGPFLIFEDSGADQVDVRLSATGLLFVTRNGTSLGTATQPLSANIWYYIEFSATIGSGTTGSFTLKVNGVVVVSGTGVNTQSTANATTNVLTFFDGNQASQQLWFDDLYSRADGIFCGDCRVISSLPTGNGFVTGFTRGGTDSGANWSQVNESPANDDTNYVQTAAAGAIDLYTYPALPVAAGTVYGVMACPILKNDSAGTATAVPEYRSGGTNYDGTSAQPVGSTTYNAYPDIQGHDPATGLAWTIAGVNNAQFGVKKVT
jgi:hypothetical protein